MTQSEDIYWNTFMPAFFTRVSDIIKNRMTKELEPLGLTNAHAIYIMALTLKDGQTMVGLSQFLDLDSSNTNHVIKVLRDRSLVCDDRVDASKKKFRIFLTPEGRLLGLYLMNFQTTVMNECFRGISDEEVLFMRNIMIRLLQNIDPDLENYMQSRYQDPFYTYLHTDLGDDKFHVMNHIRHQRGGEKAVAVSNGIKERSRRQGDE